MFNIKFKDSIQYLLVYQVQKRKSIVYIVPLGHLASLHDYIISSRADVERDLVVDGIKYRIFSSINSINYGTSLIN